MTNQHRNDNETVSQQKVETLQRSQRRCCRWDSMAGLWLWTVQCGRETPSVHLHSQRMDTLAHQSQCPRSTTRLPNQGAVPGPIQRGFLSSFCLGCNLSHKCVNKNNALRAKKIHLVRVKFSTTYFLKIVTLQSFQQMRAGYLLQPLTHQFCPQELPP